MKETTETPDGSPHSQEPAAGQEAPLVPTGFDFKGRDVRSVIKDGEIWFVAADVCAVLEQPNSRQVLARLDDDEKGVHIVETRGGPQQMGLVNDSGVYAIILTSRKPQAKEFRRWLT